MVSRMKASWDFQTDRALSTETPLRFRSANPRTRSNYFRTPLDSKRGRQHNPINSTVFAPRLGMAEELYTGLKGKLRPDAARRTGRGSSTPAARRRSQLQWWTYLSAGPASTQRTNKIAPADLPHTVPGKRSQSVSPMQSETASSLPPRTQRHSLDGGSKSHEHAPAPVTDLDPPDKQRQQK